MNKSYFDLIVMVEESIEGGNISAAQLSSAPCHRLSLYYPVLSVVLTLYFHVGVDQMRKPFCPM